jgi:hypothetical protein
MRDVLRNSRKFGNEEEDQKPALQMPLRFVWIVPCFFENTNSKDGAYHLQIVWNRNFKSPPFGATIEDLGDLGSCHDPGGEIGRDTFSLMDGAAVWKTAEEEETSAGHAISVGNEL